MTSNTLTEREDRRTTLWPSIGKFGLWLALLFAGLTLERLGITSTYLTSLIPSEIGQLRAATAEHAAQQQRVLDENQRLKGLIGREQACQDALNLCQGEKKRLDEQARTGQ